MDSDYVISTNTSGPLVIQRLVRFFFFVANLASGDASTSSRSALNDTLLTSTRHLHTSLQLLSVPDVVWRSRENTSLTSNIEIVQGRGNVFLWLIFNTFRHLFLRLNPIQGILFSFVLIQKIKLVTNQTPPCNHCWPLSVRFQKGWSFSLTSLCPDHKPILKLMAHETIYKSIQRCRSESAAPKGVGAKCELIWAVTSPEHLLRRRHRPRSGASTDWANSLPAGKKPPGSFLSRKVLWEEGKAGVMAHEYFWI